MTGSSLCLLLSHISPGRNYNFGLKKVTLYREENALQKSVKKGKKKRLSFWLYTHSSLQHSGVLEGEGLFTPGPNLKISAVSQNWEEK